MKIFSAAQVRQWDAYTIAHEPVSSINLMERAATACFTWITNKYKNKNTYIIFCGTGNNGGDGLALGRMLIQAGDTVSVYILEGEKRSVDFSINLSRIEPLVTHVLFINNNDFPVIPSGAIAIDALVGSGLSRPLQGLPAKLVGYINQSCKTIISIDIPTGLFADSISEGNAVIRASITLSFQLNKLSFLIAENNKYTGKLYLLDIMLHPLFYDETPTLFHTIDLEEIGPVYKPRDQFSHKYNFGHALLYAGSKNMMGAAILCSKACLRSGAGLVTVFTEDTTQSILQTALPEAITSTDYDFERISQKKSAVGIGPGLELSGVNKELLYHIISGYAGPLVIDATALQMLSSDTGILKQRLVNPAILTPHTGEFEKLFGKCDSDFERMKIALQQSIDLGCYIVLKGHHTLIACPDGNAFFNTSGNAGMATAGSGDVLTGILTGLQAQGYGQKDACLLGVYLHGMAGDIAAEKMSQEAMMAGDIIDCMGEAYKEIKSHQNV
ncbi:MAG: NAD(P)H-hydrate dehydratase [Ferruginibacter sp.]|nr:NAD(P)H-hydrate dehydratase [Ferruginibacter sp.]